MVVVLPFEFELKDGGGKKASIYPLHIVSIFTHVVEGHTVIETIRPGEDGFFNSNEPREVLHQRWKDALHGA